MLRIKNKLTVLDDDNGSFSDYSTEAIDYDRDTFSATLNSASSYLYVGFSKPVNILYIELSTTNTNAGTLSAEYYNGTDFISISGFYDESANFNRSGFFQWDRNQDDEAVTTVDGKELFWYRFRPSVTTSAVTFKGLNLVFSDDNDLKREFFEISDYLPSGETSHILTHVAARDHIIQVLRNSGSYKQNSAGTRSDITIFDLHEISQVKLASTYLVMQKIFSSVIDDPDDVFKQKADEYMKNYSMAIKTPFIDIDTDDDGIKDKSEAMRARTTRIFRQ